MIEEVWLDIDGWPYAVSNLGAVRRTRAGGSPVAKVGRLLRPSIDRDGYGHVTLCDKPRTQTFKVHRLVCTAFNGPCPPEFDQVRHIDGNPANNQPENLRWGTALRNAGDRDRHGRTAKGETSGLSFLTQRQVDDLRSAYAEELESRREAGMQRVRRGWIVQMAERLGVSSITVSCIVGGRGYGGPKTRDGQRLAS